MKFTLLPGTAILVVPHTYSMQAGKLNRRLILQAPQQPTNPFRDNAEWTNEGFLWASVSPTSAKEETEDLRKGIVTHQIRCRYRTDITINHTKRLLYGTRVFNILSVQNVMENKRELLIQAEEVIGETGQSQFVEKGTGGISLGGE